MSFLFSEEFISTLYDKMASQVPEFKHTEVGAIPSVVNQVRSAFNAQKTKPVEFRLVQLRKLYWG